MVRMYPVQPDNVRSVAGRADVKRLRSVGHDTLIRDNGAYRILHRKSRTVLIDKAGKDRRGVDP